MGIKGIYRELGPGRRVSLSKLAADSFETLDRPFRIAVDVAIWQFQAQAARGGMNPAIRTLFYRLVRLLGTPVQPVFVFDGPHKPAFKRNKRSGRGDGVATAQAKRLIRLFGFAIHDAPGEAEAECALLQRHGIVDAVLSEDVDTIMFGCTKTLRNWSAKGKSSKALTHVSLYDVHDQNIASLGLDREGMVLVALMSGGDYLPDGIPGCGVKVACEAAKAGFGRSICRLKASDEAGMRAWRSSLIHELRTNEQGHFRTKHKALVVPDDFPSLEVLRYYTHPVVSQQANVRSVRQQLERKQDLYVDALREFARETFGWDFRIGAIKFIRVLGQALLIHNMCQQQRDGQQYVKRISGRRLHFSTDATPELRMAYVPSEVVPIDLSKEVEENISSSRDGLALNSDDEFEAPSTAADAGSGLEAAIKAFDVTKPDLAWVLEGVARKSIPETIQEWEDAKSGKAARKSPGKKKVGGTRSKQTLGEDQKKLEQFLRIAKGPSGIAQMAGAGMKAPSDTDKPVHPPSRRHNPLRPPRLPSPRSESKQSPPRVFKNPETSAALWVVGSSPVTPRLRKPADRPEAILISSSPVGPPASSSPSADPRPRPRTGSPVSDAEEGLAPIFPSLATGGTRQELSGRREYGKQSTTKKNPSASRTWTLKQSSMDTFVRHGLSSACQAKKQPRGSGAGREKEKAMDGGQDDGDASDLEHLSSLLSRVQESPSKRRHQQQSHRSGFSQTPSPTRKKLLVPHASAAGFFGIVEMEPEERERSMAREADSLRNRDVRRACAVRWSDVSVIDLTGGTDVPARRGSCFDPRSGEGGSPAD